MTIQTIYAIHAPEAEKLSDVVATMQKLGAPSVRVVDCGDHYMALEGSHRLAAADVLGITPALVVYEQDDTIDITTEDWYDEANWGGACYRAGEVAGELFSPDARAYRFEDL